MMQYRPLLLIALSLVAMLPVAGAQSPPPPPPPAPAPPPPPPPVAVPPAPPACATADHRAFDFWVGEWDVFANGSATQVATSSIEAMFAGCAIRETWKPRTGGGGGSFSHYDAERRHWRQAWVDSSGARVDFDGGPANGKMVLTGHWANVVARGKDGLIRMTYSKEAGGAVRQHGEQSTDHGLTWTTSFDFIYKPQKAGEKRP
ncbi:hypothetical protein [Sphingopyxis sp.]|uniref:hypothetical protein n=1 Tax=Sphingopyxis sp. TaxID=1908224 RepID=UPI00257D5A15|nr:hypothetical protein [Sphingopyxis sp.]